MLKYTDTEVVFKEVPNEITLAINISGCPIHCSGCHSPELWGDIGDPLTDEAVENLIKKNRGISCISFMGGDNEPTEINRLASVVKYDHPELKIAWYSGREEISHSIELSNFDFIKVGPYIGSKGGLDIVGTNQVFYEVRKSGELIDITNKFLKERL